MATFKAWERMPSGGTYHNLIVDATKVFHKFHVVVRSVHHVDGSDLKVRQTCVLYKGEPPSRALMFWGAFKVHELPIWSFWSHYIYPSLQRQLEQSHQRIAEHLRVVSAAQRSADRWISGEGAKIAREQCGVQFRCCILDFGLLREEGEPIKH